MSKFNERILKSDEKAMLRLRSLYQQYGYSPYKMGRFEEYELYVRNKDFLVSEEIITFTDRNGRLLALKPDVTLSIIKNTADNPNSLQKLYYSENVYRVSKGAHSFKEIMQTGLECVGDLTAYSVAEVVMLAIRSLMLIGERCVLDISHMGLIAAVFDECALQPQDKERALSYLQQKNTHGLEALCIEAGLDTELTEKLLLLATCSDKIDTALGALSPYMTTDAQKAAFADFDQLCRALSVNGLGDCVRVDFSVGNDMKYYSGVVFNGYLEGIPTSILSGGQYDKLLHKMGRKSGAIGFALYLDLLEQLEQPIGDFDIDTVVLHEKDADAAALLATVQKLSEYGEVLALTDAPKQLRYRRLVRFEKGEVTVLEDNG